MALACPGSMGGTARKMATGNKMGPKPWDWQCHPQLQKEVTLTISCCFLCSCDKHLQATLSLLLQDLQCCFRELILWRTTYTNQGAAGSSGAVQCPPPPCESPSWAALWQLTKSTWWPILGQLMELCHSLERKRQESDEIYTFGPFISQPPTTPTSPPHRKALPRPNHMFPPSSPILTCITSNIIPPSPEGGDTMSLHTSRWDSFLLQRLCGCHHLSRPGVHVSTLQRAPQTGVLWRHTLWHWKPATSRSHWGRGRKSSVV